MNSLTIVKRMVLLWMGLGILLYSPMAGSVHGAESRAGQPQAAQNVIWEKDFNALPLGDYVGEVAFFANGSRSPDADNGRASSTWIIAEDLLDPQNKVLQNVGGANDDHDSWYFVETVNHPAVNRGQYTIYQADIFIPSGDSDYDTFRVGLFGLIDLEQKDSYGAWFKWSERKMRVGKLQAGQEMSVKSSEFAALEDTDQWYTLQLRYQILGTQLNVTASIWPKTNPAKVTTQSNTVDFTAKKTFALGIYMYSNDKPFKMWDNFKAIEEIRPAANAGLSFKAAAGQKNIRLDGSQSTGAATYKWELVPRTRIIDPNAASEGNPGPTEIDPTQSLPVIRDADQAVAQFDAPAVIPIGAERLEFKLTINAGTADESSSSVFVYLQSFGGPDVIREGFAPPAGGWDYTWDGDLSPLNSIQKFQKNFSFDYDLGSYGQVYSVPPAGWAGVWCQSDAIVTLHTESGLIVCRYFGDTLGTFLDLDTVLSGLGANGVFDETGATLLIRARNLDLLRDDGQPFSAYPWPFDSRTGAIDTVDESALNPDGTRIGIGNKTQDLEAALTYGSLDNNVYVMHADGEDPALDGTVIPSLSILDFSTLWVTLGTVGGKNTINVYNAPDKAAVVTQTITRHARRQNPFDGTSSADPNLSNNYLRIDIETVPGSSETNALCIDFLCLKRGIFSPTSKPADVSRWMLF
ncbi:MAG: hypothetical protein ACE15F_02930 [bacterium]